MQIALLAVANETYKRLLIIWDYKFNVLIQLLMIGTIFIGAGFFLGGGRFDPQQMAVLFIGYIVWFYARIVMVTTSADLVGEAQSGTLEQMYMSPVAAEILMLGRVLATLVSSTIMVVLTGIGLALLINIHIPLHWEGLMVLCVILAGLFGFTLMLSGFGLVFKQIEALADLLQNALLFLTGALLPISHFPAWLAIIAQTLPTTQGIIVLRSVMLDGRSLAAVWADGSLLLLLVHSTLYVVVGWLIFKWCERTAKRQATLSQY